MNLIINDTCDALPHAAYSLMSQGQMELNLLSCLGYDAMNPPLADLLCSLHGLEGTWLVLSPIQWHASHNDALISACGHELNLDEEEAKDLFLLLSNYLVAEGISLFYHDATTWLMQVTDQPIPNARPLPQIVHQSLMPQLSVLDPSMYWQKKFTEFQMVFATASRQSLVNGIWAWGAGALREPQSLAICCDEPNLGIATHCASHVTGYKPELKLQDFDLFILSSLSVLSTQHQQELQQISANYYWNNHAYHLKKTSWYRTIWRVLTNAH